MTHPVPTSPMYQELASVADLDRALLGSAAQPILVFKHSRVCGISTRAYEEIRAWSTAGPSVVDVYLVDVVTSGVISRAIAARLHTAHASPQVLLVSDGRVCWTASHSGVTAHAIRTALASLPLGR